MISDISELNCTSRVSNGSATAPSRCSSAWVSSRSSTAVRISMYDFAIAETSGEAWWHKSRQKVLEHPQTSKLNLIQLAYHRHHFFHCIFGPANHLLDHCRTPWGSSTHPANNNPSSTDKSSGSLQAARARICQQWCRVW